MEAYVHSTQKDGLATIEFFHPSHNSLPGDILAQLKSAIDKAGADDAIRLILLKSGGERTFCAGASFTELVSIENEESGKTFFMGFANVINAIRTCGKIVIGRVQGKTVGGGVGLASAVDFCIATKYASIRLSELAVGIGPFVIGPAVVRKVGMSCFQDMSLTPDEWKSPQYAMDKNLFHKVFDDASAMDQYIDAFTQELLGRNPKALTGLKKVFWEGTDHWDKLLEERAITSGKLILSDHAKSSIKGFLNK